MSAKKETSTLKDQLKLDTKPLKPYNYEDCMQLKEKGYTFFGTNFTERPGEQCLILYPFRSKDAATKFSKDHDNMDVLVISIDENLHELNKNIKEMSIYVQFF